MAEVWRECLFVLDTNVLLGLYRYPKEAHDDLIRTFRQISDRLWIPHQVGLEYQENRLSVIAEQLGKYNEVSKILGEAKGALVGKIEDLQLKKRHSVINPESFLVRIDQVFGEFENELETLKESQPDIFDEDNVRKDIDALFEGKIGEPLANDELQNLYMEGKERYEQRRPPGYLDKGKSKQEEQFYFYGDSALRREYGDLIIWYQLIKEVQTRKSKYVVFITDDDKDDWWWTYRGKTIGPRPELAKEISQKAGVSIFYMYNSARFLKYAKEYIGAQINQETINQIREISQVQKQRSSSNVNYGVRIAQVERLVYEWLESRFGTGEVSQNLDFPGYISDRDGVKTAFEVKYIREPQYIRHRYRELAYRAFYEVTKSGFAKFYIVFVVDHEKSKEVSRWLRNVELPENVGSLILEAYSSESGDIVGVHFLEEY